MHVCRGCKFSPRYLDQLTKVKQFLILKIFRNCYGGRFCVRQTKFFGHLGWSLIWFNQVFLIIQNSIFNHENVKLRQFNLIFNPGDSTVEMSDNRSRKTFLKKTVTTEVRARGVYSLSPG